MRKKVDLTIEYREEGEKKEIEVSIDFISNWVTKEFSKMISGATEVASDYKRINEIHDIITTIDDLTDEEVDKLKKEIEELNANILKFNDNGYLEDRSKLLKTILIDNGYKDNEMLMSDDFWDKNIEPSDLMVFLYSSVYKDTDDKKKVVLI